jgi:hypothetical protein
MKAVNWKATFAPVLRITGGSASSSRMLIMKRQVCPERGHVSDSSLKGMGKIAEGEFGDRNGSISGNELLTAIEITVIGHLKERYSERSVFNQTTRGENRSSFGYLAGLRLVIKWQDDTYKLT